MLVILILIAIGAIFYNLADKYKKQAAWVYALLGPATYYASLFLFGVVYGLVLVISDPSITEEEFQIDWTVELAAMIVGFFIVYLLYFLLERNWKKNKEKDRTDINEIGKK